MQHCSMAMYCCWQHCSCAQHCKAWFLAAAACWWLLEALQHYKLERQSGLAQQSNTMPQPNYPSISMVASSLLAWPNTYNKNSTLETSKLKQHRVINVLIFNFKLKIIAITIPNTSHQIQITNLNNSYSLLVDTILMTFVKNYCSC